jgi:tripartite-type tricarboxylate transporter receptor subunit TctC
VPCVTSKLNSPYVGNWEGNGMKHFAIAIAIVAALISLVTASAYAQTDYPNQRIHIIVPYPAGGIGDVFTRIVSDELSEMWQQPIVVEAKPGASGNLGWDQVSRAKPDGYTMTFIGPAVMANPRMFANLRWSEKSFVPVSIGVWAPSCLVVRSTLSVDTVAEFIDYAQKNPGAVNWAKPGTGSSQHLNSAIFLNAMKLNMVEVPYTGQPPAILDLMANRLDFMVASIGLVAGHVGSGALKALAVLGATRSAFMPNVPTMSEAGYPEVNVVPWYGFAVPRGTPQPVIDKIVAGFDAALSVAKVRGLLEKQALQPAARMSAGQITELYEQDTEKYAKVIREVGISISN